MAESALFLKLHRGILASFVMALRRWRLKESVPGLCLTKSFQKQKLTQIES
jgi:hypothetical protein